MSQLYERNYRKIASLSDLEVGKLVVYRAGGATIVLRRSDGGVEAIDGSCLSDSIDVTPAQRLQTIVDCVAAEISSGKRNWSELVAQAGLPVKVDADSVWVCVEACSQ